MAVILSPQAAIQEKINASQRSETKPSGDAEVSQAGLLMAEVEAG